MSQLFRRTMNQGRSFVIVFAKGGEALAGGPSIRAFFRDHGLVIVLADVM